MALEHYRRPTDAELRQIVALGKARHPNNKAARDTYVHRLQFGRGRLRSPRAWIEAFVKIEDRAKKLVPFVLNYGQRWALAQLLREGRLREVFRRPDNKDVVLRREGRRWRNLLTGELLDEPPDWAWEKLERELGPINAIILKARQIGISTMVQMLIFELQVRGEGSNAKLMAHDDDTNLQIWRKQRVARENLPFEIPVRSNNESEFQIEYGEPLSASLSTSSAQAKRDPGRGSTFQHGHLTELPQWEPRTATIMAGLLSSFHDVPGAMLIAEATAKGAIGWFHDRWFGSSDWRRIFIPWFWMEEYRREVTLEEAEALKQTLDDPRYSQGQDESWLLDQTYFRRFHGDVRVDLNQLAWRRWCIENRFEGDLEKFRQEFPAYAKEAFLASGRPVFPARAIEERLRQTLPEPVFVGDLAPIDWQEFFSEYRDVCEFFERRPEPNLVESRFGNLKIWKKPDPKKLYGIGGDTSEGVAGGDFSSLFVIELASGEFVAEYHGLVDPVDLARTAARLGWWYNCALVAPEKNNHGYAMLVELVQRMAYPNPFRRTRLTTIERPQLQDFGWDQKANTRRQLFDHFRSWSRYNCDLIPSRELLLEMQGMTYDLRGNEVAPARGHDGQKGHDDRVIAAGIALQVREEAFRMELVAPPPKPKEPFDGVWKHVDELLLQHEVQSSDQLIPDAIPRR